MLYLSILLHRLITLYTYTDIHNTVLMQLYMLLVESAVNPCLEDLEDYKK
jgi:hypothetical protein